MTKFPGYFYMSEAPTCGRMQYRVDADMRWAGDPGAQIGLAFGDDRGLGHVYLYTINTVNQEALLIRFNPDGAGQVLLHVGGMSMIHSGTASNHLTVIYRPGEINLYINGFFTYIIPNLTSNALSWAGLVGAPYSNQATADARYDNFRVIDFIPGTPFETASGFAPLDSLDRPLWPLVRNP